MKWMTDIHPDMGFDCASAREIDQAIPLVKPNRIIYAQPCKKSNDIEYAQEKGVKTTVADSVEEIEKLELWKGDVLIRLLVSDTGSKQPFGKKFGAPIEWLPNICQAARNLNLNITGFSFHVGSECQLADQYSKALQTCKDAERIIQKQGFDTQTIDIGGGFLPDPENFKAVANHVEKSQRDLFPHVHMIAEPGRFLAATTHTLYTTVIGKKPVYPPPLNDMDPQWRITIDESIYGSFSNIPFDHQKPVFELYNESMPNNHKKRNTIVFGRTCDSGDYLGDDICIPDVQVGDKLKIQNMGAYTTVTASEFNGFPKPHTIYTN